MMEAFSNGKTQPEKIFCINEHKISEFIKMIIIGYNIQKKLLFDVCSIQKSHTTEKKGKEQFKELIKNFGTDCTRAYAVDTTQDIEEYGHFANKLWNASRFVSQHAYEKK